MEEERIKTEFKWNNNNKEESKKVVFCSDSEQDIEDVDIYEYPYIDFTSVLNPKDEPPIPSRSSNGIRYARFLRRGTHSLAEFDYLELLQSSKDSIVVITVGNKNEWIKWLNFTNTTYMTFSEHLLPCNKTYFPIFIKCNEPVIVIGVALGESKQAKLIDRLSEGKTNPMRYGFRKSFNFSVNSKKLK